MSLNISEIKELLVETLNPFFKKFGFNQKCKKKDIIEFIKKHESGEDGFSIGILNYGSSSKLTYYAFKRDKHIIDILSQLNKKYACNPPINKQSHTFTTSYELIKGLNTVMYLPSIQDKTSLNEAIYLIKEHCITLLFPELEYYSDIVNINTSINQNDFWETDWRKPFNLGGNFIYKRLIISKLANPSNFQNILDKQLEIIETGLKGENAEDYREIKKGVYILFEILENKSHEA